ncbi:XRN 5'-3' exonuclease N-terminus-domain-containing protein [Gamsiella multidivaricata]|uniref:XRN 5'-3' exonuclease N-terminus-domain-containing protein n=1 Tax=Gamsiella multidivaricata TaxID=101098 RepID=UPI00221EF104|nr:XRN 5'-3' exonuclease N-terminus-domain-containing protein [Gamsiella multidivaricata]KAI7830315.1 XRN 5'-3' exonuclease N-terminus-domain-containing protein [Gamsiella multidivaricata]
MLCKTCKSLCPESPDIPQYRLNLVQAKSTLSSSLPSILFCPCTLASSFPFAESEHLIMGLKQVHFIDWFQAKFPMAVRSVLNQEGSQFDSVFIDVNGILHPAVRTAKNEAMFVKKLFSILDKLLTQFIPNRICYLSVDGPAPVAKMLTQKARRASKGSKGKSEGMSTLHITPGCPFMTRLEHYLSYYSVRYLQHRRLLGISPDLKFIIDHSNNPGEGESKIIENIVQQAASIRGRPCAILSMDSDAVLQAIALGMPNMYVIRKDSPFTPAIVISIDRFMNALERMFPSDSNQIRLDFCALCLFRGNDYLPGLFVGLDRLWDVYLYTKLVDPVIRQRGALRFLVSAESKTFDLFFLKQLILNSYMNPKDLRAKVSDIGRQQPIQQLQRQLKQMGLQSLNSLDQQKEVRQQKQQNISTLSPTIKEPRRSVSEYEDESDMESLDEEDDNFSVDEERDGGSDSSEDSSTDSEETSEKEGDPRHYSVKQFLDGVLWNLEMYCTGKCPDVSFCYNYRQGPPRRALVDYVNTIASISHHSNLHPRTTKDIVSIARSDKKYVHPLVCALILLPPNISAQYLPQAIAAVQTQIVPPGSSSYLTQEELEIIDLKVQTLIDILGSSDKAHDAAIAKDLSVLYTTRSPYIWTRVRCVNPRARLTLMPQNPNVIIDEANAKARLFL